MVADSGCDSKSFPLRLLSSPNTRWNLLLIAPALFPGGARIAVYSFMLGQGSGRLIGTWGAGISFNPLDFGDMSASKPIALLCQPSRDPFSLVCRLCWNTPPPSLLFMREPFFRQKARSRRTLATPSIHPPLSMTLRSRK